jgi:hypothetical protein
MPVAEVGTVHSDGLLTVVEVLVVITQLAGYIVVGVYHSRASLAALIAAFGISACTPGSASS